MKERAFPPLIEAFLVLEQPQQRLAHWRQVLAPLDDRRAPPLAAVNGYYDPTCDQALLGLSYDELALGGEGLAYVIEAALRAGTGMVQPSQLSEADRRRFLGEPLARCTVTVAYQRSVIGALIELVRRVDQRRAPSRHVISRAPSPPPVPEARRDRASTVQMDLRDAQRLAADDLPDVELVLSEPTRPNGAEGSQEIYPLEPFPSAAPLPPGNIYARYLRSGRWVPVRIGALSLRGAALLTGALPRVHDPVEIALGYADFRARARGMVHRVSTQDEAARRGAASFHVGFDLDDSARRQLTALLHAARAANVTIKPPPPRGDRRFPVQWPVCLDTSHGPIRGVALDISREGMFVQQMSGVMLDTSLRFSVVLDDGSGPVSGRAYVVRFVDPAAARRGLAPGYGLHIVEMADADRERWDAFVARIERRAELRVLIGATRSRLRELQGRLAAAGYAVAVATDPASLVQLASGHERAVDACLIDAGWAPPGPNSTWSEKLFPTRSVPCVAMRGDVRRAREAIDQVLSIV
jgi:hypothetical protein